MASLNQSLLEYWRGRKSIGSYFITVGRKLDGTPMWATRIDHGHCQNMINKYEALL